MRSRFCSLALLLAATAAPAFGQEIATQPLDASRLVLSRTDRRLAFTGDPIWNLELQTPGSDSLDFETVTGRAHQQNANRHRAGTRAPLPPGTYSVGPVEALGPQDPAELGPVWIGLEPRFPTGRGHLGIHLDPSANRNANSGTLGCVGLIHSDDMLMLARLIEQRKVRKLVVME